MKIKNLELNADKFADNAIVLGKFALNYGGHTLATALVGSYVLHNIRILPILLGTISFVGLGISCHRISDKIAKEAKDKDLPISPVLNPTLTKKK
jgi:hypothetical protein